MKLSRQMKVTLYSILIAIAIGAIMVGVRDHNPPLTSISFSDLAFDMKNADPPIDTLRVEGDRIIIRYSGDDAPSAVTVKDGAASLTQQLADFGVTPDDIQRVNITYAFGGTFADLIPLIIVGFFVCVIALVLYIYFKRRQLAALQQ